MEPYVIDTNSDDYKNLETGSGSVLGDVGDTVVQGLKDTDDIVRRGFVGSINKVIPDTLNNLNSLWDAGGDYIFGEGDYRIDALDDAVEMYNKTFMPSAPKSVAGRTVGAITTPIATFMATRRVIPQQWGVLRDIAAEGGASILRDNYQESLANLGKEFGPQFMKPIFNYLAVEKDDPIYLAIVKRSVEDMLVTAGVESAVEVARGFTSALKGYKAIKNSKSLEESTKAENIAKKEINSAAKDIRKVTDETVESTQEPVQKIIVDSPKDPLDMTDFDTKDLAEKLREGRLDEVGTDYFNRNHLRFKDSEDMVKMINTFENALLEAKNKNVIPKHTFDMITNESMDMLTKLGIPGLARLATKTAKNIETVPSQIVATRFAYDWFIDEYDKAAQMVFRAGDEGSEMQALARFQELENMLEDLGRLDVATAKMRKSSAVATAAGRIQTRRPNDPLKFLNNEQIERELKKFGNNHTQKLKKKAEIIHQMSQRKGGLGGRDSLTPDAKFQIFKVAQVDTFATRLQEFSSDRFRRNILFNIPTTGLNATMGVAETFLRPLTEYLGTLTTPTAFSKNKRDIRRRLSRQIIGMYYSLGIAQKQAFKAFYHNKALLDPFNVSSEQVLDKGSAEYLLGGSPLGKKILDAPLGTGWFIRTSINLSGLFGKQSYRLLNATDEFIKDLNYYAKAYSHTGADLIEKGATRKQIQKKLLELYSDNGEALGKSYYDQLENAPDLARTREKSLQYSREVTYTDDTELTDLLRGAVNRYPMFGMLFPFVRTPIQILAKGGRMTTAPFQLKRLNSPDEEVKVRALGELAGTMAILMPFGFWALEGNRITGPGPRDLKLKKTWEKENKPYSIKIGDTWYDYGRYAPWSIPIKAMTTYADAIKYGELKGDPEEALYGMFISMMSVIRDEGTLRGVELLSNIMNNPERYVSGTLDDMLANTINPLGKLPGQVVDLIDGDEEHVYIARTFTEKLEKNMGVRNPKAIAYNWITGQKDDPVQNTLVSIPYSKQYKAPENDVVQEIIRIGEPGLSNGPPRSIEGEMLNGEQISYFQQQVGNTKIGGLRLEQALRKVMNSKEYTSTGSDLRKATLLMPVKSLYFKEAEKKFLLKYPILGTKIVNMRTGKRVERKTGFNLFPGLSN